MRWLARCERRLLRRLLDVDIESPYRPLVSASRLGRVRDRAVDPATWKDLAYLLLLMPLGLVSATVVICLGGTAVGFLTMPLWVWTIPGGIDVLFMQVDTVWEGILAAPLALPAWLLLLLAVRALTALHAGVARALLSPSPDPAMIARMSALQDSRARIIAAADAERRRLERDLHDGAQQRLVALSMALGLAKRRLALPEPVEAAAYFTVAEALTNVAKYAQASAARVAVARSDGRLEISVSDDGVGGAEAGGGSGLRGLADRLGALGGELDVESPSGRGTRLLAAIPLDQPEPEAELAAEGAAIPAAPSRPAGERSRRILQSHIVVYASVMVLLVFIWLTTGAGYFWPQWPIAAWGLLVVLHAWFAQGRHRGMLAAETQPDR